jgi:hypothetical protein
MANEPLPGHEDYQAKYRRTRKIHIALLAANMLFSVGVIGLTLLDSGPNARWWYFLILVPVVCLIAMNFILLRCPRCRRRLGRGFMQSACRHCGLTFL